MVAKSITLSDSVNIMIEKIMKKENRNFSNVVDTLLRKQMRLENE